MLQVEYFALLFLIVYVGAIVVLFLFMIMMLEIKIINITQRFKDLFSYKGLIVLFLTIEVLFLISQDFFELASILNNKNINYLNEANLLVDYSNLLHHISHVEAIGGVLFTEYKLTVIIVALLLFLSMIGSIVLTIETSSIQTLKSQDANYQTLRHPKLLRSSLRFF
jgi:NADH:ubiquinone oxidoreductase subunit 6 (subunit J)